MTHKESCFIISEIGVNHNGDIDLAKQMDEGGASLMRVPD